MPYRSSLCLMVSMVRDGAISPVELVAAHLRQMLEHISALVLAAPMNDRVGPEGAYDGRADGLATIDHE